jgi:hypothetical protein
MNTNRDRRSAGEVRSIKRLPRNIHGTLADARRDSGQSYSSGSVTRWSRRPATRSRPSATARSWRRCCIMRCVADELCKLKVKDVRRERRGVPHLKISGKSGKTRYLALHPAVSGLIADYSTRRGRDLRSVHIRCGRPRPMRSITRLISPRCRSGSGMRIFRRRKFTINVRPGRRIVRRSR